MVKQIKEQKISFNMKNQGELCELIYYTKCYSLGYTISKPFGDNAKYDFVLDKNGKLYKIQVKSTNIIDNQHRNNRYRINASHGANNKRAYNLKDVDIIACYIIPLDLWYNIPIKETNNVKTLALYPHIINSNGKYEKYKEFWDF